MKRLYSFILLLCMAMVSGSVFAEPVNINKADAHALAMNIKGIGLKKAEAIVAYRKAHGRFKSVDELSRVKGIGVKTVENNRKDLRVAEPKRKK